MRHDVIASAPVRPAVARPAAIALVGLLSVAWFFRFQVAGGFSVHFGDRYDALIEVAILQHWTNVLAGAAAWDTVPWFHPHRGTLGYNDGYLLTGLLYAVGRWSGLSMTMAAEAAHAVYKIVGFVGMYALLRHAPATRPGWSLFGAALFTVADITLGHANHGQFFTLGLAPWAALLAWRFAHRLWNGDPVWRDGVLFAMLFAAWISTAYYLAWFFTLFALVTLVVAAGLGGRAGTGRAARAVVAQRVPLAGIFLIGTALLVPFLLVYLPKALETGMHDYAYLSRSLLLPLELLNTGDANLLWSGPTALLRAAAPYLTTNHDFVYGSPPLFLVMTLVAVARLQRTPDAPPALVAVSLALVLCWMLVLDYGGWSPWRVVHAVVPGAGGIREVGRIAILLLVPAVVIVTALLDRMHASRVAPRFAPWFAPWFAIALAAVLLVEQVATTAPVDLAETETVDLLAGLPPPPGRCRGFYVVSARATSYRPLDPANDGRFAHNVDAMMLAAHFRVPTINGFSTFAPSGWNFAEPTAPDYRARVRAYLARFGLRGMCELDRVHGRVWVQVN